MKPKSFKRNRKRRKYMNECRAWLFLAGKWRTPHIDVLYKECHVDPLENGAKLLGLCPCVKELEFKKHISHETARRMQLKIKKLKRMPGSSFVWERGIEGAWERSQYCSKQADRVSRK